MDGRSWRNCSTGVNRGWFRLMRGMRIDFQVTSCRNYFDQFWLWSPFKGATQMLNFERNFIDPNTVDIFLLSWHFWSDWIVMNLIDQTIVGTIFCFLNKYSTEFNPLSMENFRGKLSETVIWNWKVSGIMDCCI